MKPTVFSPPASPSRLAAPSYEAEFYAPLFAAEDRHFWFRARNRAIAALASQIVAEAGRRPKILEVGCGNGNVLAALRRAAPQATIVGLDLYVEGLRYARSRTDGPLVQGDVDAFPFRTRFDLIGLFDVIEHLPDDSGLLRRLHDLLEPGGRLLITVPAHQSLWSYFDEVAHHCRRYEATELTSTLVAAGYAVEYCTQYMMAIYPLVWLRRWASRFRRAAFRPDPGQDQKEMAMRELTIVPVVNGLLDFVLSREAQLLARRKRLPLGTSLLAVARERRDDREPPLAEPASLS
jgi:SAM-dependent methyltransferase